MWESLARTPKGLKNIDSYILEHTRTDVLSDRETRAEPKQEAIGSNLRGSTVQFSFIAWYGYPLPFRSPESPHGRRERVHALGRKVATTATGSKVLNRRTGVEGGCTGCCRYVRKGIEVKNEDDETDLVHSAYHRKSNATATATRPEVLNHLTGVGGGDAQAAVGRLEKGIGVRNEDDETNLIEVGVPSKEEGDGDGDGFRSLESPHGRRGGMHGLL
ncbi:hypothetical protein B0H11DRAFT_1939133 [Mycena galericulata]|nr:hypothetical protein B0H11DRAFT_1939133 [Mycena galericulata]